MKFLLIEGDVKVADLLRQALAEADHEITVRNTGEEGLAYLAGSRPDAIFMDVRLPKMNGIEVLRRIRVTDPTLPVILLTGRATVDEIAEAKRLGVAEVIAKPYVLRHFSEALDRVARPGPTAGRGTPRTGRGSATGQQ